MNAAPEGKDTGEFIVSVGCIISALGIVVMVRTSYLPDAQIGKRGGNDPLSYLMLP